MKIKTLIVDDEEMARSELIYLLDLDQRFELAGKASNGKEAIKILRKKDFGLVLLDIKMPEISGIEVAQSLKKLKNPPQLVFTTAYDEYAIEAFKLAAIDYLLKPISEERFQKTLERVWDNINENKNDNHIVDKINTILKIFESQNTAPGKIAIEDNGRYRLLDYDVIYYFSTADTKVRTHTENNSYLTHFKLKELEERLPSYFFRLHRSYIVNLCKVKEVIPWFKGKYQVVIDDNSEHEIPVSRNKVKQLNDLLNLK